MQRIFQPVLFVLFLHLPTMLLCLKFAPSCFVYIQNKQEFAQLILPSDNGGKMSENKTGKSSCTGLQYSAVVS